MSAGSPLDPWAYPFDVPKDSYLWHGGSVRPLEHKEADRWGEGRTAVLAVGSNAAPAQLRRKFAGAEFRSDGDEAAIPVLRAVVPDLDVVHAALLASYGAIPATAIHAPGTEAHVFVSWLTDRQLERMHQSEGLGAVYRLETAAGVWCAGRELGPVPYYAAIAGALALEGAPVGLAAVHCTGSGLRRMSQIELWSALAGALGTGLDGPAYAAAVRNDRRLRAELRAFLRTGAATYRAGGPP